MSRCSSRSLAAAVSSALMRHPSVPSHHSPVAQAPPPRAEAADVLLCGDVAVRLPLGEVAAASSLA